MEAITHKTQALVGKGFRAQWVDREMIRDDKFQDSHKLAVEQSNLATRETNDCVVRAFSAALDISYDSAHGWVKRNFSRKFGKGTYTHLHIQNVLGKVKNGYKLKAYGCHPDKKWAMECRGFKVVTNPRYKNKQVGYTLKSFMESHPKGRFFVIVERHAVAIVDGVLYGNTCEKWNGLYRRVNWVVECK
jgi:hypothetical protein